MTPADNEQANAALLFELDQKIEERIRGTVARMLGVSVSSGDMYALRRDLTYAVGRELLDNNGFLNALSEEITKRVYSKFNPAMPMYTTRTNTF